MSMSEGYAFKIEGLRVEVILAGAHIEGRLEKDSTEGTWKVGTWSVDLAAIDAYRITE